MKKRTPIKVDEFNIDSVIKVESKKNALTGLFLSLIAYIFINDEFGITSGLLAICNDKIDMLIMVIGAPAMFFLGLFGLILFVISIFTASGDKHLKKIRNNILDGKIRPVFYLDRKYVYENVFLTDDNCLYVGPDCYEDPNIVESYVETKPSKASESSFIVLRLDTVEKDPVRRIKVTNIDVGERELQRLLNFFRYH